MTHFYQFSALEFIRNEKIKLINCMNHKMQILAHTFSNIFVIARNRKLLNVSLQVVIYIMFFAFDGNDDKYQTIIHRISMRCRLFMMLANVAQNPFCHNIKKSPHAMHFDIPIGICASLKQNLVYIFWEQIDNICTFNHMPDFEQYIDKQIFF